MKVFLIPVLTYTKSRKGVGLETSPKLNILKIF